MDDGGAVVVLLDVWACSIILKQQGPGDLHSKQSLKEKRLQSS